MNAESVFTILMGIVSIVKLIKELMLICQQEFPAGSGEAKKSTVLESLATIVGDNTVWEKVKNLFGVMIDCIAIFKTKKE
jgi:hypothetical protein